MTKKRVNEPAGRLSKVNLSEKKDVKMNRTSRDWCVISNGLINM